MAAASSNVKDKFLKKLIKKKTVKGTLIQMYKNIRTDLELVSLIEVINENKGIIIMMAGIPRAVINRFWITILPLKVKRANT
ncbi:hypothetical protein MASR2M78_19820 [Treponema sp.]